MIIIAGKIPINPDKREEAIKVASHMAQVTQTEDGCISYQFYADITDPNTFLLFEEWESTEALAAHFKTEHIKEFRRQLPGLLAGSPQLQRYEVSSVASL